MFSQELLAKFVAEAQAIVDANWKQMGYTYSGPPKLSVEEGKRYVRIVRTDANGSSRSVHCFVDKTNGDILKAASWKAPAKHARGNIEQGAGNAVTAYGGAYLK